MNKEQNIIETGLTSDEVRASREAHGSNRLTPPPRVSFWKQWQEKCKDPTIIILSVCSAIAIVSDLLERQAPWDGIAILIAVGIATLGSLWSERKADKAFELLKRDTDEIRVKVVRDGKFSTIANTEIVVGDIIHLETGDKIPADAEILSGVDFKVDESLMTGESRAVEKSARDARVMVGGTYVVSGSAVARVSAVGDASELGKLASSLNSKGGAAQEENLTPLQKRLKKMAEEISVWGTTAAALIFIALVACDMCRLDTFSVTALVKIFFRSFMVAVTIVVVAVPEGLPLAVFVTLGLGMRKIREDNNLVRKMVAAETIGSTTVICSDKTGTLTRNQMSVERIWFDGKTLESHDLKDAKAMQDFALLARSLAVNSTAEIEEDGKLVGNRTEGALLEWLKGMDISYRTLREETKIEKRLSFSADRKRMTTVGGGFVFTKGAPERVLPLCTGLAAVEAEKVVAEMAAKAVRPLAVAYKADDGNRDDDALETGLTLLAVVGLSDPVRDDVPAAVGLCRKAGIEVKMITGDHPLTAHAIAEKTGILEPDDIELTGDEFAEASDEELSRNLPRLRVISRAKPNTKVRLVELLQRAGEVVAMTGDGTNDAPALKKADVGISMGIRGTDVAKAASDIILTDDNFGSILRAVKWGRTLYENLQKFLQFQLTVNLSALGIAFISPIAATFWPAAGFEDAPLTVLQFLWINLIMDTLAAIAFGLEPPRKEVMDLPPKSPAEPFVTRTMGVNIVFFGIVFIAVMLLVESTDMLGLGACKASCSPEQRDLMRASAVFNTFVWLQLFNAINSRSVRAGESAFANIMKSHSFLGVMLFVAAVQIVMVQFGGFILHTAPLPFLVWLKTLVLGLFVLGLGEALRLFERWKAEDGK